MPILQCTCHREFILNSRLVNYPRKHAVKLIVTQILLLYYHGIFNS